MLDSWELLRGLYRVWDDRKNKVEKDMENYLKIRTI